jgi:hypothetical protein
MCNWYLQIGFQQNTCVFILKISFEISNKDGVM